MHSMTIGQRQPVHFLCSDPDKAESRAVARNCTFRGDRMAEISLWNVLVQDSLRRQARALFLGFYVHGIDKIRGAQ